MPMIIVMRPEATDEATSHVTDFVADCGVEFHLVVDQHRTVIVTEEESTAVGAVVDYEGVERVIRSGGQSRLVSRAYASQNSVIDVSGVPIGGDVFVVIAGPCAVESKEQMLLTATAVAASGARMLRGDAFKPRTSPYSFQGLGEDALKILADVRDTTGLPFVAEVLDPRDVELVASYADLIRVGTRNMSNYPLLKEVGGQPKPVMLKRGRTANIGEWLSSAEYVYSAGNPNIVLVERGIRTFESSTRNTLDLTAVPQAKRLTHLPVLVDPSHATGRADLVPALSRAALAVGADGLLIDVHPDPATARVDGAQALLPSQFDRLMRELRVVGSALGLNL
jgi:3-deoxy-7-phosphoheptulonate synthase